MFRLARVHHITLHLHARPHPHIVWHRPVAGTRIPILHGLRQCWMTAMQGIRWSRRHRLRPLGICDGLGRWSVLSMFVRQVERTSAKRPALPLAIVLRNKYSFTTSELCHYAPSETHAIDNPSPYTHVLCCLRLQPAVPQNRLSTFLNSDLFSRYSWVILFLCEYVVPNVKHVKTIIHCSNILIKFLNSLSNKPHL